MDFIIGLLNSDGYTNMIVIIDRLSKGVIADNLKDIVSKTIVKGRYFLYYSFSYTIISDYETQFVDDFGAGIYMKLRIKRRLSTAYSPETDGSTEYTNQEMKNYLGEYVSFAQDDGLNWLDVAMNAINTQDFFSTETSSFFMKHDGHLDIMNMELGPNNIQRSSIANANHTLRKLQDIRKWA